MITEQTSPLKNLEVPHDSIIGARNCKTCGAPLEEAISKSNNVIYHLDGSSVALNVLEPYTTEDLENVPFGFEFLSKPCKALEINFNNIEELRSFSNGSHKEQLVSLSATANGSFDAIASWFHLNLDNNGTKITSAPFEEGGYYRGTCWHQAIFPSIYTRQISCGDTINLCVDTQEGVLKVREHRTASPEEGSAVFLLSDSMVAFLNNTTWKKALQTAAAKLNDYFISKSDCEKKVLDLNPFPILGLEMLKKSNSLWKLQFKAKTESDKDYILAVARNNSINVSQIQFLTDASYECVIKEEHFDIICLNVIDSSGELAADVADMVSLMK